jgi:mRNA-degrading endonuclease YafQ of YafQ-DinJ toxin-antitoxin module
MKKDLKRVQKRGYDMQEIAKVIEKAEQSCLLKNIDIIRN